MLKSDSLKGALIYYDGQHNDARMNLAIILTAIRQGAKVGIFLFWKIKFFECFENFDQELFKFVDWFVGFNLKQKNKIKTL